MDDPRPPKPQRLCPLPVPDSSCLTWNILHSLARDQNSLLPLPCLGRKKTAYPVCSLPCFLTDRDMYTLSYLYVQPTSETLISRGAAG
jgi:hypothetical protein